MNYLKKVCQSPDFISSMQQKMIIQNTSFAGYNTEKLIGPGIRGMIPSQMRISALNVLQEG